MPLEMVIGLVFDFIITVELEVAVSADALSLLGDTLLLTEDGLTSSISMGESMDKVVPDNEVDVVALLVEDTLLLTMDGLCSSSTSLDDALLLTDADLLENKLLLRRPYAFTVLFLSGGCSEVLNSSVK